MITKLFGILKFVKDTIIGRFSIILKNIELFSHDTLFYV